MRSVGTWDGRDVLDVGCGTGFHLPWFAATAASVVGVEPHPDLVALARRRTRRMPNVTVHQGTAQDLPVPDASVDVAHARWAYFFGPGCEPGLAELDRVMRRGGTAFVIDNDGSRSTFGRWFSESFPKIKAAEVEAFWTARGWHRTQLDMGWRFERREDLEAVIRIEFTPADAERIIASHPGVEVDYAINLWSRTF
jgi:ubiquinone/menaquinone biosynthesis C-methylase UbiE